ncbi:hypothetical protein [Streptomyces sp. NPDC050145]|uniref:hypothetical protein n=1 Tax=Streptomyces sp. NPDC050145 TaxID=3365602 RepID=UPI00378BC750
MSHIDELLSRALLVRERSVPCDVVPSGPVAVDAGHARHHGGTPAADRAAEDLRALCETVVTHTPASAVADFVTDQVPQPRSALVLACVLQLTDTHDGARSWWEYAAGAGQPAAAYCLYLHHLALGERDTADWWHTQTDEAECPPSGDPRAVAPALPEPEGETAAAEWQAGLHQIDPSTTGTVLRVLRQLAGAAQRPRSAVVSDLMAYIPTAVASGYLREPDMDLPMPGSEFAERINTLVDSGTDRPAGVAATGLPARPHREVSARRRGVGARPATETAERPLRPTCGEPASR